MNKTETNSEITQVAMVAGAVIWSIASCAIAAPFVLALHLGSMAVGVGMGHAIFG